MRLGRGLDTLLFFFHFLQNKFAELLANLVVELLVGRAGQCLQFIREVLPLRVLEADVRNNVLREFSAAVSGADLFPVLVDVV